MCFVVCVLGETGCHQQLVLHCSAMLLCGAPCGAPRRSLVAGSVGVQFCQGSGEGGLVLGRVVLSIVVMRGESLATCCVGVLVSF